MIDIQSYRCRIGCFVQRQHSGIPGCTCRAYLLTSKKSDHSDKHGCWDSFSSLDSNTTMDTSSGAVPFIKISLLIAGIGIYCFVKRDQRDEPECMSRLPSMDSNTTMDTTGAVSFINMLLLIAGIESNPGPTDVFVFRYHYLLIQVGSEVLRKLFDKLVGNDFMRYLFADPKRTDYNQLQYLINTNKISDHMKQFLPPLDNKPMSSNFDITLLALLLRNVCGLKPRNDTVWTTPPAPGCVSLEEDVTRLRLCRNELQHSTSVTITEKEFTAKWGELCRILHRLNNIPGGPLLQLQPMIGSAETVVLDEKLKEQLDASIEAWKENDDLIKNLKKDVDKVKSDVTVVRTDMSDIKSGMNVVKDDISDVKGYMNVVKSDINVVKDDMDIVKSDVNVVKDDMDVVKGDMNVVKCDMNVVKGDLDVVKCDMNVVKGDMNVVKGDVDVVKDDIDVVKGDMNVVKGDMSDVKGDMGVVKDDMDVFKKGLFAVKGDVEEVLTKIKTIKPDVKQVFPDIKGHNTETEDIRDQLIKIYEDECRILPVSPLYEQDDTVDLLLTYKSRSLWNVPYHRTEVNDSKYNVTSYKRMFRKDVQQFRKVFITGDAGVGKSTLCKRMALIWSMAKLGKSVDETGIQDDIDFMKKFELVYYISLSGTSGNDVVKMIVDQLFETDNVEEENKIYQDIKKSLRENECLVILDALDERTGNGITNINRVLSDKSTYLCTCRPYRIEQDRLSSREIDRQIQLTGIQKESIWRYVADIVTHLNKTYQFNKILHDFFKDVLKCRLYDQLHIPIIAAHLVTVWFDHSLTDMSRGLIYSNIVDMLFKRAEMVKHVDLPSSTECEHQFPASLSELCNLKKHASFLKKIGLLAFNLLFKRDKCMSELIFTVEQLESEPYCMSVKDINFLCKIGILSKSKVIGRIGREEQKIAFLHKTYMEFFTALFVTVFDTNNAFDDVVMSWSLIDDVVQYETFFIFLAGISYQKSNICFEKIHDQIQNDLHSSLFNYATYDEVSQIRSLQSIVLNCLNEVREYSNTPISYRLDHFIFDDDSSLDDSSDDDNSDDSFSLDLMILFLLNISKLKGLHCVDGEYRDEFNQVNSLQYLSVEGSKNETFNQLFINNQSTLHTVRIYDSSPLLVENVIKLQIPNLRSIFIGRVRMSHDGYHDLIGYLSCNIHMENIKLSNVECDTHSHGGCLPPALNIVNHSQLHSLCLWYVNVTCNTVNTSSLKSLALTKLNKNMDFKGIFNSINSSMVESLNIGGYTIFTDDNTVNTLLSVISTLSCFTYLKLWGMWFPVDSVLRLHCDIRDSEIDLIRIIMSRACFEGFIDSLCNIKSHIKMKLSWCIIYPGDGDTRSYMSYEESVDYMTDCVKQKLPHVNITEKYIGWSDAKLSFETSGSP